MEAISCGGVVIFRGKVLVLYKNIKNKYEGWVLPKGTVEEGEEHIETALREVREESGVTAAARWWLPPPVPRPCWAIPVSASTPTMSAISISSARRSFCL